MFSIIVIVKCAEHAIRLNLSAGKHTFEPKFYLGKWSSFRKYLWKSAIAYKIS